MTPSAYAFVCDLALWAQTELDIHLIRAFRSAHSGVEHDVAAAYATIAGRVGPLLDAIARERLALPARDRDAVLMFAEHARALRASYDPAEDAESLRARIAELFASGEREPRGEPDPVPIAPTLSAPVEFEPGIGVRAKQTHFSASALNTFAECPRKWYYRYACATVEDAASSASTYGTAFHAALEDFHAEFPQPNATAEKTMRHKIVGYINWAFERFRGDFATVVEVELQKRRAQRTAAKYVDWLLAESKRSPFTVVGRELAANMEIEGFDFVGYIDRVDRNDDTGGVTIVDYKTGSIASTGAEYRDKVRRFRDFQLPFYYWARTAAGDRVSRLALIPLKDALLDITPVALEVVPVAATVVERRDDAMVGTISISELERARARMIEICRDLTSGRISRFAVTDDATACTYCAYQIACNDRPYAAREKFGR